ncbi:hypothetical protein CHUAL_010496 [Chamberlinius hualienensis]
MTKTKTEACFWIKGFAILISVLIMMMLLATVTPAKQKLKCLKKKRLEKRLQTHFIFNDIQRQALHLLW